MPPTTRRDGPLLTRAQARAIDRLAAEELGLPTIVLMENAARALAGVVLHEAARTGRTSVIVAAGPGSNGGDGLAAARWLAGAGLDVHIRMLEEPGGGDALIHRRALGRMGIATERWERANAAGGPPPGAAIVVDSLLGTGLSRPLEGRAAAMVAWINARRLEGDIVVAADLPSGLDADSGDVLGVCVRADLTVSFIAPKVGMVGGRAEEFVGRLVVADIGVPACIIERVIGV